MMRDHEAVAHEAFDGAGRVASHLARVRQALSSEALAAAHPRLRQ
jgi:hypothetical protein